MQRSRRQKLSRLTDATCQLTFSRFPTKELFNRKKTNMTQEEANDNGIGHAWKWGVQNGGPTTPMLFLAAHKYIDTDANITDNMYEMIVDGNAVFETGDARIRRWMIKKLKDVPPLTRDAVVMCGTRVTGDVEVGTEITYLMPFSTSQDIDTARSFTQEGIFGGNVGVNEKDPVLLIIHLPPGYKCVNHWDDAEPEINSDGGN